MKTVDFDSLEIAREPLNDYGSLEGVIRGIRAHRPLDLNAEQWRKTRPNGSFGLWHQSSHQCLMDGLHYDPGKLSLQAEVLGREERSGFVLEHVAFNTTPWIRVNGFFLLGRSVCYPACGIGSTFRI